MHEKQFSYIEIKKGRLLSTLIKSMKKAAIFLTAAAILTFFFSSSVEAADYVEEENDISIQYDERKHGWLFGEVGIYYELVDYQKDTYVEDGETIEVSDSDLIIPFFHVNMATPTFKGFSLGVGLTGYAYAYIEHSAGSGKTTDYYSKLLVHQLYLEYDVSRTWFRIGRMKLENSLLLRDYYEAFSLSSEELNNVFFLFALVESVAESDITKFTEFRNLNRGDKSIDDYLCAVEASWRTEPEVLSTTVYYVYHGRLYNLYGLHLDVSTLTEELDVGVAADAYATKEDEMNGLRDENDRVRDSDVYHINPFVETGNFRLGLGYIKANPDVGARVDGVIDDYFNPFNEGNRIYDPDARTWYASLDYGSETFEAGFVYGRTAYRDSGRRLHESEAALKMGIGFMENYRLETEFSIINSESPEGNYRLLEARIVYDF